MTERNKVIEALEACVLKDPDDSRDCKHCPRCNYGAFITNSCINGVMADALALLKTQEPDETRLVRHYSRPNVYADLWLHCEKCGGVVDDRYRPKFCPECGRKVKWK